MLTYYLTDIFSIMFNRNLNMTTFKCFGNVMCLQGSVNMISELFLINDIISSFGEAAMLPTAVLFKSPENKTGIYC